MCSVHSSGRPQFETVSQAQVEEQEEAEEAKTAANPNAPTDEFTESKATKKRPLIPYALAKKQKEAAAAAAAAAAADDDSDSNGADPLGEVAGPAAPPMPSFSSAPSFNSAPSTAGYGSAPQPIAITTSFSS